MYIENIFKDKKYISVDLKKLLIENKLEKLPYSMRILFENCIRKIDPLKELNKIIGIFSDWLKNEGFNQEIPFNPSRVLMQDFTGVPAIVDLAAMRDEAKSKNQNPLKINPLIPVDLVIDHSIQIRYSGKNSLESNIGFEIKENRERYEFLKYGQESFKNLKIVPPGMGICHQVNLEYLSSVIFIDEEKMMAFPETIVGTDSHTTMINGLGVIGFGVGGIEAESAMLGESLALNIPKVVGFKIYGELNNGITATDLVLTITNILRKKGVVGKIVEFYGEGVKNLNLPDRATIANMAPEYGATCGFFPIDNKTIEYLRISGRDEDRVKFVEKYSKENMLFSGESEQNFHFSEYIELNLNEVKPCLSGPKRPQDLRTLSEVSDSIINEFIDDFKDESRSKKFKIKSNNINNSQDQLDKNLWECVTSSAFANKHFDDLNQNNNQEDNNACIQNECNDFLKHGDIVLAAITSCTNTSNPSVLIAAGLLAKAACEKGLKINKNIKRSLAPGSKVVSRYLEESGLQKYLDELGFYVSAYGCTTCIGNSGPLNEEIEKTIIDNNICVGAILSGNRNFEGRIHPLIKANYLASPPLVIAYAIAGSLLIDIEKEGLGISKDGKKIFLSDIWPSNELINEYINKYITREIYLKEYSGIFEGTKEWRDIIVEKSEIYNWDKNSTYIQNPPYFKNFEWKKSDNFVNLKGARILALLGDSITTDHISPAGSIKKDSPAGQYLIEHGIKNIENFNSYGSRRGNHEIMMRGTFANIRLKNFITKDKDGQIKQGGFTRYFGPHYDLKTETKINEEMNNSSDNNLEINNNYGEIMSIYDASTKYQNEKVPLIIIAGKEYGSGSSRDWAAKGPMLLGVKAVIARSFERIHRSNLVGMGIFPFIFEDHEMSFESLGLEGDEIISINLSEIKSPFQKIKCRIDSSDMQLSKEIDLIANIFNDSEISTLLYGGIMQKVMMNIYS